MPKTSPNTTAGRGLLKMSARMALMLPVALLLLGPEGDSCSASLATPCVSDADCVLNQVCTDNRCAEAPVCACPEIYAPVCGEDGNTYGNACEADCAEVAVAHEGECGGNACADHGDCTEGRVCYPPTKTCEPQCSIACLVYDPVCGTDGVTYGCGEQDAWCHGAEVAHEGECGDKSCTRNGDCGEDLICYPPSKTCETQCDIACLVYDPVCGTDGFTYGCGEQDAWCHGAEVARTGECGVCICTTLYDPVCGANGVTYSNACEARCAGVEVSSEGPCPDAGEECTPEECGPGILAPNFLCEDGTVGGPGPCVRNDAGVCSWTYVDCPPA